MADAIRTAADKQSEEVNRKPSAQPTPTNGASVNTSDPEAEQREESRQVNKRESGVMQK